MTVYFLVVLVICLQCGLISEHQACCLSMYFHFHHALGLNPTQQLWFLCLVQWYIPYHPRLYHIKNIHIQP